MLTKPFLQTAITVVVFLMPPALLAQGSLSLDLADDAARIQYANVANMSADTEFEWDLGLLLTENDTNDDTGKLITATARSVGDTGVTDHEVTAALGVRAFWLHADEFDAQALAIGGEFSARLQGMDRLVFSGYGYYAPSILSFSDADEVFEIGLQAGYQVLRNGDVFLGYRRVTVDSDEKGGATLDVGFHIGLKFDL